jgi:3-methyladenine DNA glycosylase AlkD
MTKDEVMKQLEKFGSDSTKKTFLRHGAREPIFGVKIADLKTLQKTIRKDYALSMALYDTGNSDAMYLAGLIADESKMTKKDLEHWADNVYWHMLSKYTVAWVTSLNVHGYDIALKWIDSEDESIGSAGWSTLSSIISIKPDEELDIEVIGKLMDRVEKENS